VTLRAPAARGLRAAALAFLVPAAVHVHAASAASRPPRVGDTLCVSQAGPPLLGLAPEGREAWLGALDDAGWRILRTDFTWATIEPRPGELDYTGYDDLVARAQAHHVGFLGILDYGNPWASSIGTPGDDHYPPDDPRTFARFAEETARRYRGRVAAWEIWNEPNNGLSGFWKPRPDPAGWAHLAAVAAPRIRDGDPRARVITGGLAPTLDLISYREDWGFLRLAVAAEPGLLGLFDAGAIHPYTFLQAPPPEIDSNPLGPSVQHQIEHFRMLLDDLAVRPTQPLAGAPTDAAIGAGESRRIRPSLTAKPSLPIWVTEIGWHTAPDSGTPGFPPGVSELDQARFLVRSTVLALAERAELVCWYTLSDYANAEHNKEDAFGLLHYQAAPSPGALDPKPAYGAATVLARVLGETRFSADLTSALDLPPGAHALRFRADDRQRSVVVVWTTAGEAMLRARLDESVTGVRVVQMDGSEQDLGRPAEISLELGASPLYLVLEVDPS